MKTLMVLSAAALLAMSGTAPAGTKTTTVSFDGYCDVVTFAVTSGVVAGTDACGNGFGGGLVVRHAGEKGHFIVGGVQFPQLAGNQFVIKVSYPLVTGGTWTLYDTTDGQTLTQIENGTYTVQTAGSVGSRGTLPSIADIRR